MKYQCWPVMYSPNLYISMPVDNFLRREQMYRKADRYKDHHHHQGDVEIVRWGIGA